MECPLIDMPKVAQMLDAGWSVTLAKNDLGTYTAMAKHDNDGLRERVAAILKASYEAAWRGAANAYEYDPEVDWENDALLTDDFTPEEALTRLAYKVHGEII